ncbi:MAG: flagellar protein FlgN [Nitrosomonadales bacterium]|nr:flagellar protein FlgN [Nitrosomonadales bacterium]
MNQNRITGLSAALTAERGALVNFVALLEHEQRMLVENRTDQLLELSGKKTTDALSLNELAEARRSLMEKSLPQSGANAVIAWMRAHSPEGLAVWQEILALAKRSQQLNRTNGELIQLKLRHNQQSLAVLSSAVNKANLYGPDGQPSFSPGSGRSLGSG